MDRYSKFLLLSSKVKFHSLLFTIAYHVLLLVRWFCIDAGGYNVYKGLSVEVVLVIFSDVGGYKGLWAFCIQVCIIMQVYLSDWSLNSHGVDSGHRGISAIL